MDYGKSEKITPERNLMLDVLKPIEEFDTIFFVPHPDGDDDQVTTETTTATVKWCQFQYQQ